MLRRWSGAPGAVQHRALAALPLRAAQAKTAEARATHAGRIGTYGCRLRQLLLLLQYKYKYLYIIYYK